MTVPEFIKKTTLDHSLLLGYYGGGNYGDELLLEVLQNLLAQKHTASISIAYQRPDQFRDMHHDLGFRPFNIHSKLQLLKHTIRSKNIIVGGGGLWGIDMNFNTLIMSIYLWAGRWLFRKNVYLLGVGYYCSTPRIGHIGAWFAGKAANQIFARDPETYENFYKIAGMKVHKDKDLAWYIATIKLDSYKSEARVLGNKLGIHRKTLFITIRRPQSQQQQDAFHAFHQHIDSYIVANPNKPVIIAQLELADVDPGGHALITSWHKKHPHAQILQGAMNPLVLYTFFQLYREQLALVGPQFHIMLTAHLNDIPFFPVSYDNKVNALLDAIGIDQHARVPIAHVTHTHIQQFSDQQLAA